MPTAGVARPTTRQVGDGSRGILSAATTFCSQDRDLLFPILYMTTPRNSDTAGAIIIGTKFAPFASITPMDTIITRVKNITPIPSALTTCAVT